MSGQSSASELRVALVMGGGVSLGTFSGGAMAELCRILEKLQRTRPVRIDVATGASAGAMTLAVFFRYLYAGADASSIKSAMQDCWVHGVGVDPVEQDRQLLPDLSRHSSPSLLSDRPLQVLGQRHVLNFAGVGRPNPLLADRAYLSFSLTNLNGIEHRAPCHWSSKNGCPLRPQPGDDALVTTQFQDRIRFRLHQDPGVRAPVDPQDASRPISDLSSVTWQPVLDAALASGAFPGVFAPRRMLRHRAEYGELWPRALREDTHVFSYVDGGLFDNEPLKEALGLANRLDRADDPACYERVFLFVDPVVSGSASRLVLDHEIPQPWRAIYEPDQDRYRYAPSDDTYITKVRSGLSRVSTALFGQATFRDWLHLGKINERVDHLEELLSLLGPHLDKLELNADEHARLDALRGRIARADALFVNSMPVESPATSPADAGHKLRLVLKEVAGLQDKRDVNVIAISPLSAPEGSVRLAGDIAGAFGGFFKESWRAHDFEVGQAVMGHTLFCDELAQLTFGVHQLHELGATPMPKSPPTSHYDLVDPIVQERVEEVIQAHLEELLHDMGVPHFVDHLLAWKLKNALLERLRQPSWIQTRPFLVELRGPDLTELHALAGATERHSIAAFGDPPRIVVMLAAVHNPRAEAGAERYRLHGPQLFVQEGRHELRLDAGGRSEDSGASSWIRLVGEPRHWFEWAGRQTRLPVDWQGQTLLECSPQA